MNERRQRHLDAEWIVHKDLILELLLNDTTYHHHEKLCNHIADCLGEKDSKFTVTLAAVSQRLKKWSKDQNFPENDRTALKRYFSNLKTSHRSRKIKSPNQTTHPPSSPGNRIETPPFSDDESAVVDQPSSLDRNIPIFYATSELAWGVSRLGQSMTNTRQPSQWTMAQAPSVEHSTSNAIYQQSLQPQQPPTYAQNPPFNGAAIGTQQSSWPVSASSNTYTQPHELFHCYYGDTIPQSRQRQLYGSTLATLPVTAQPHDWHDASQDPTPYMYITQLGAIDNVACEQSYMNAQWAADP